MNKKEILDFIKQYQLPLYPISGVLVYVLDVNNRKAGDLFLPENFKQSAIRSGEVLKGVVVSNPINCEEEPDIKLGTTVMFKAASGTSLNINGHPFHSLEVNEILAILDDE